MQIHLAPYKLLYVHLYVHKQPQKVSHISMDLTMEEATPLLDNDINSPRDQRNYPKNQLVLGCCLALAACLTFTWIQFFVKTFDQDFTDILFTRSVLQTIIFAGVVKYYQLSFWLDASNYESRKLYWLNCFLMIFQVSIKISQKSKNPFLYSERLFMYINRCRNKDLFPS